MFPPVPLIRRKAIVKKLKQHGAFSEETVLTLEEVGVIRPNGFPVFTERLVKKGILIRTPGNKYYLNTKK